MNRTARRRQEKLRTQIGSGSLPPKLHSVFVQAVAQHKALQFAEADSLYRQVLGQCPSHPDSLHLLGLTHFQRGNLQQAAEFITSAIASDQSNPLYHFNLGLVHERSGQLSMAASAYQRAIHLNPSYIEAQSNLGNVFRLQGRLDDAVRSFQEVLRLNPQSAEAQNNLGVTLKEQGKTAEAITAYRAAIEINPSHAEAWNNLGVALKGDGHVSEAKSAFQEAVKAKPNYANAHYHLGLTLLWQQRTQDALACFHRSAELTHNHGNPIQRNVTTPSRIKHDLEQLRYLHRQGISVEVPQPYLETLERLSPVPISQASGARIVTLSQDDQRHLAPSFSRILHHGIAHGLSGGTLNPDLDVTSIEARYHEKKPEITYLDHLLNEEALNRLRRFCLEATVWKKDYHNGYLGAFLAEGFASPLLLQIAEELRLRLPNIFQDHQLAQAWAFKYDSTLQGLNLHADAAAVNVNFWITPNEANLDETSGGLVVWDQEAPDDWDFKTYNSDQNKEKIREFLHRTHAQPVTVPHRQNRALIFNSNLFHETDTLSFRDDYESRRINVTLLYGYRQQAHRTH
ncbi:MAG: tetratricopeptide repeat protein [Nitrospirales bacterium]|nr:tetratricopeptide repeat protein [Nitrospira sp.]MDR4500262.1 tetratricopeptide repeat protein [Nitrospirales bacterium]